MWCSLICVMSFNGWDYWEVDRAVYTMVHCKFGLYTQLWCECVCVPGLGIEILWLDVTEGGLTVQCHRCRNGLCTQLGEPGMCKYCKCVY